MDTSMAAAHRQAFLAAAAPGSVAVIPTGGERVRSRDTHFPFRPHSDFWYLTGFPEPDAVLVAWRERPGGKGKAKYRSALFVLP